MPSPLAGDWLNLKGRPSSRNGIEAEGREVGGHRPFEGMTGAAAKRGSRRPCEGPVYRRTESR